MAWEYRAPDGAVHGPFGTAQILAWRAQGFFTGAQQVHMRPLPPAAGAAGAAAAAAAAPAAVDDLMADFDDDDDDDDDEGGAGNAGKSGGQAASGGTGTFAAPAPQAAEWTPSDEIDFAQFT
jgi:CD2 antigen cytoplasmic tail-binding protein 2